MQTVFRFILVRILMHRFPTCSGTQAEYKCIYIIMMSHKMKKKNYKFVFFQVTSSFWLEMELEWILVVISEFVMAQRLLQKNIFQHCECLLESCRILAQIRSGLLFCVFLFILITHSRRDRWQGYAMQRIVMRVYTPI